VQCVEGEASPALIDSYKLSSATMAKRLWRLAVEHHAFFRRVVQFSFRLDDDDDDDGLYERAPNS